MAMCRQIIHTQRKAITAAHSSAGITCAGSADISAALQKLPRTAKPCAGIDVVAGNYHGADKAHRVEIIDVQRHIAAAVRLFALNAIYKILLQIAFCIRFLAVKRQQECFF